MAERERDSWQRRAERLKGELAAAREDAAQGWAKEEETRAAAQMREAELLAETRRVEVGRREVTTQPTQRLKVPDLQPL